MGIHTIRDWKNTNAVLFHQGSQTPQYKEVHEDKGWMVRKVSKARGITQKCLVEKTETNFNITLT